MSFKDLGLKDALLRAVKEKGYTTPSPIQEKAIPHILAGKDVLASAQTGTGKTAGFTLPVLQYLSETKHPKYRPLRALVLTPTRELAAQVYDNVREYSSYLNIRSTVVFGGVKAASQIATLRRGVDILVATPGRLLDLHNQKAVSFKRIDVLILDEADRMLDMGFVRDINKIISYMPTKRQNLLFSATFSKEIKQLAQTILKNPVMVEAEPENSTAEMVSQKAYRVNKKDKTSIVTNLIKEGNWNQVLIFMRTKHGANKLTKKLLQSGVSAAAIHGNKSQGARTKALSNFKTNAIRVLVATDIAARGLDIPLLPHVVNFELPNIPEDYVHRIGRTGRAGQSGKAVTLVNVIDWNKNSSIERYLKIRFERRFIKGLKANYKGPVKVKKSGKAAGVKKKSSRPPPSKSSPVKKRARNTKNIGKGSRVKGNSLHRKKGPKK